jgi:hypothetical protein
MTDPMWFEEKPYSDWNSWAGLWFRYVLCGGHCSGIRTSDDTCPACGDGPMNPAQRIMDGNGQEMILAATFMGAEGAYEDYIYLQMLQREWERPEVEFQTFTSFKDAERPAARAALVLLFWSYFETRIERLHRATMRHLPKAVLDDALRRYSGIGSRLSDLYKVFHGTTYFHDLRELGFDDVETHLRGLHAKRNEFAHGKPQAINDATVEAVVSLLKREHEAWIAVYNHRLKCTLAS